MIHSDSEPDSDDYEETLNLSSLSTDVDITQYKTERDIATLFPAYQKYSEKASLSRSIEPDEPCLICNNLSGLQPSSDENGDPRSSLKFSLYSLTESARNGCVDCDLISRYCFLAAGKTRRSQSDDNFTLAMRTNSKRDACFRIPEFDAFPMIGHRSFNGGYLYDEIYYTSQRLADSSNTGARQCPDDSLSCPCSGVSEGNDIKPFAIDSITVLRDWINTCLTTHKDCISELSKLPTRVIDVSGETVSLVISTGEAQPFAALSHCWGRVKVIETTKSTLDKRRAGISWNELSKTFQDAVTITRLLGLRYLWIDSLCIIQDDPADWILESEKMSLIYEGARIVLAASEAVDGTQGFLHPREHTRISPITIATVESEGHTFYVKARPSDQHKWYTDPLDSPSTIGRLPVLSTRGWCFQEQLLATRYVQFRSKEIVWECRTILQCECGYLYSEEFSGRKNPYESRQARVELQTALVSARQKELDYTSLQKSRRTSDIFDLWPGIVRGYNSYKSFTAKADIFPALSGLAKQFKDAGAGVYVAGIWEQTLPLALAWRATGSRAVPYRAPTWSWASVDTSQGGSIDMVRQDQWTPDTMRAIFESVSCNHEGTQFTGRIKPGANIIIHAPATHIIARKPESFRSSDKTPEHTWNAILAHPHSTKAETYIFQFHADIILEHPFQLLTVAIAYYYTKLLALVLQRVSNDGEPDTYERVGLIRETGIGYRGLYVYENLFKGAAVEAVTII